MYLIYFAALAAKEEAVKLTLNTSLKIIDAVDYFWS